MHHLKHLHLLLLLLLPTTSLATPYDDANVKAAFIHRLLYFIEQPHSGPLSEHAGLTLCIWGNNPTSHVKTALEQHNHIITVVQKQADEPVTGCNVLYITNSETSNFTKKTQSLHTASILTISDINQFAKYGGMIGFTEYNNRLRLEINTKALAAAQFAIDPHLLEVALHVYP